MCVGVMNACMSVDHVCAGYPWRQEEDKGSSEIGVTDVYELRI